VATQVELLVKTVEADVVVRFVLELSLEPDIHQAAEHWTADLIVQL
jgi:hypothetical protein